VNSGNVISVEEEIVEFHLNIEHERGGSPLNASFDLNLLFESFLDVSPFLPKKNNHRLIHSISYF
jgi:hypothetical protein